MDKILKKVGLLTYCQFKLNTDQGTFANKLNDIVENKSLDIFSDMGDVFSRNEKNYKGSVTHQGFEIRRKRKLFDMNMNFTKIKGTFEQNKDALQLNIELRAFHPFLTFYYVFLAIIYSIFLISFIFTGGFDGNYFVLPFILVHALFMAGIPYLVLKRGLKKTLYEIEREFNYLVNTNIQIVREN